MSTQTIRETTLRSALNNDPVAVAVFESLTDDRIKALADVPAYVRDAATRRRRDGAPVVRNVFVGARLAIVRALVAGEIDAPAWYAVNGIKIGDLVTDENGDTVRVLDRGPKGALVEHRVGGEVDTVTWRDPSTLRHA